MNNNQLIGWEQVDNFFAKFDKTNEKSILLGKYFSSRIWTKFKEQSLYKQALEQNPHSIKPEEPIFKNLKTCQFEKVFRELSNTMKVLDALKLDQIPIKEHYKNIQQALIYAVKNVHLDWKLLEDTKDNSENRLSIIREQLRSYKAVYYTAYDLIIYWAINFKDPEGEFVDFFWNKKNQDFTYFNKNDTDIKPKNEGATKVINLHGGLHLCYEEKEVKKITYKKVDDKTGENILDNFQRYWNLEKRIIPLFVAEGTAEDKLEVIRSSDYLSFALDEFKKDDNPLVILGQAIAINEKEDENEHIWRALALSSSERAIAFGINTEYLTEEQIQSNLDRIKDSLKKYKFKLDKLVFFKAQAHPLYDTKLR